MQSCVSKYMKFVRGIAQLVEHRSPKPSVVSSNLTAPANKRTVRKDGFFYWHLGVVDENSRESEFDAKRKAGGSTPVSDKRMSAKEQALRSNVADNLTAPATQDEDAKKQLFYKILSNGFLEPFAQLESVLTYSFVRCGTFAFQTTL